MQKGSAVRSLLYFGGKRLSAHNAAGVGGGGRNAKDRAQIGRKKEDAQTLATLSCRSLRDWKNRVLRFALFFNYFVD